MPQAPLRPLPLANAPAGLPAERLDAVPVPPLRRPRTVRAARVIAEALFATEQGPPPVLRMEWLETELDDLLEQAGAARRGFQLAVTAVHSLAPLLSRRPRSLKSMTLAERVTALSALESSKAAAALFAVKILLCLIYYEHPDAARSIGFDGRCLKEIA